MTGERRTAETPRPPMVGEGRDPELVDEQIAAGKGEATPVRLVVGVLAGITLVLAVILATLVLNSFL